MHGSGKDEWHIMTATRLAIVLLLAQLTVFGASDKLSNDLKNVANDKTVEIIVQFDESLDLAGLREDEDVRHITLNRTVGPTLDHGQRNTWRRDCPQLWLGRIGQRCRG